MRVLVVGSGGREHALVWRLSRDSEVSAVLAAPGNPGMAALATCLPVDANDPAAVLRLVDTHGIDLTVVGPEGPLDRGIADRFADRGRPIVGPSRACAALETSKAFAKRFMARAGIPTARYVESDNLGHALDAVSGSRFGFPVVVKADGLAAGKGVVVAADRAEAEDAVRAAMVERRFGSAGATVVIEECLVGPEVSYFVLADDTTAITLGTAHDHKRIGDDDRGPNTGGMGALAPSPMIADALDRTIRRTIVDPAIRTLGDERLPYRGFLYVSLMLTAEGPKVIEFNVRLGDPEAQVLLPLIDGPFAGTLWSCARGTLASAAPLRLSADVAVGVVLASRGYPGDVHTGDAIDGLAAAAATPDVVVFQAGTTERGGHLVTAGGRVMTIVGRAPSGAAAIARAYDAVARIHFDGMQYRRDIGRRVMGG